MLVEKAMFQLGNMYLSRSPVLEWVFLFFPTSFGVPYGDSCCTLPKNGAVPLWPRIPSGHSCLLSLVTGKFRPLGFKSTT